MKEMDAITPAHVAAFKIISQGTMKSWPLHKTCLKLKRLRSDYEAHGDIESANDVGYILGYLLFDTRIH